MLLASLNALLAFIFASFAWRNLPRGLAFLRSGWTLVRTYGAAPDVRVNIEKRQMVDEGGRLLIAGFLWLGAVLASALLTLYFAWQVPFYLGLF